MILNWHDFWAPVTPQCWILSGPKQSQCMTALSRCWANRCKFSCSQLAQLEAPHTGLTPQMWWFADACVLVLSSSVSSLQKVKNAKCLTELERQKTGDQGWAGRRNYSHEEDSWWRGNNGNHSVLVATAARFKAGEMFPITARIGVPLHRSTRFRETNKSMM